MFKIFEKSIVHSISQFLKKNVEWNVSTNYCKMFFKDQPFHLRKKFQIVIWRVNTPFAAGDWLEKKSTHYASIYFIWSLKALIGVLEMSFLLTNCQRKLRNDRKKSEVPVRIARLDDCQRRNYPNLALSTEISVL